MHHGPESSPSTDSVSCSSFDEVETEQKKEYFIDRMARKLINSEEKIDQRMLSLYRGRDVSIPAAMKGLR